MSELKPAVHFVGAIDWDRRLFDEIIPLPVGTSYNSYLIQGSEKTALLDTVDPTREHILWRNLERIGVKKIDYIVAHHGEQDHSGVLPAAIERFPMAKIVANQKCRNLLIDLLHLPEDAFIVVEDWQELSLGDKTLQFIFLPWVHWPETFGTYLKEDRILFPCDFFGSHVASSELFSRDDAVTYEGAKRYYAEIMMPFRSIIRKNLEKLKDIDIDMIASSHGPVYRNPSFIIDAYNDWTSDKVKNQVVLPYVSMHDSTRRMVEYFTDSLATRGIEVFQLNLVDIDIGRLAISLVDAATLVVGSPTFLTGPHPKAAYAAVLANALRPKTRFASIIGSYGWGGRMVEQMIALMPLLKAEILDPVIAKGLPRQADYEALDAMAETIASKHREIGIL